MSLTEEQLTERMKEISEIVSGRGSRMVEVSNVFKSLAVGRHIGNVNDVVEKLDSLLQDWEALSETLIDARKVLLDSELAKAEEKVNLIRNRMGLKEIGTARKLGHPRGIAGKKNRTKEDWLAIFDEWRASGLSQRAFAIQKGIHPVYFYTRRKKFEGVAMVSDATPEQQLTQNETHQS